MALSMPTISHAAWGPLVPAHDAQLRWEGRARFTGQGAAVFDWSNVRAHFRFKGDALAVCADLGQNYLDALVDGQRMAVLGPLPRVTDQAWAGFGVSATPQADGDAYLITGLGDWEHEVVLSKRTGPNFGPVTLRGLRLAPGHALLAPPPARLRRLEFVGDSLTNGYGDEGTSKACAELAPYENSSLSWARLTAEALKAELQSLAFSGYGLVRNYGAATAASKDPVPYYYPRTVLAEPGVWDRRAFVPDLVVVFLGTNDHSTQPAPSEADFTAAYHAFLGQLRQGRPQGLPILLAYPDDGSSFAGQVQTVVRQEQALGRAVEGLALPPAGGGELGCDWHPLAVVHAHWAELTEVKIRKMLHW
jgi:lysophospholipase L1-like esterase